MTRTAGLSPDTIEMVITTLGDVLRKYLPDERMIELDTKGEFPTDLIQELVSPELGMHLLFLPEEVGGLGGGARDICRVSEVMAAVDLGVATAFLGIFLGTEPLLVGGTPAQKAKWLTPVADEGWIVAYCVTEPEAGSNLAALKANAERITDGEGTVTAYRLNGTKQFITNGGVAHLYTVMVRAPDGPSFFVVERGTEGLSVGRDEDKHGIRASNTTSVILEDVVVPVGNLVGGVEGEGMKQASAVFGHTRLMVGAFGLGAGRGALERSLAYARERVQFGTPLIEKEGYTLKLLVPHVIDLHAGRSHTEEIALRLDEGETGLEVEGAIAKLWCTEAGNRAADAAVQAHGGYGYMKEYIVEKIRRDVRITNIYEGTSEILQSIVGLHRWKAHVRSRGAFYGDLAASLEAMHARHEGVGADLVAAAARSLARVIDHGHRHKLPRHQIALFAWADMATRVEVAAAFCRKSGRLAEEGDGEAARTGVMSRIFARETLRNVSATGRLCAVGFTAAGDQGGIEDARELLDRLAEGEEPRITIGEWADMAEVARHWQQGSA